MVQVTWVAGQVVQGRGQAMLRRVGQVAPVLRGCATGARCNVPAEVAGLGPQSQYLLGDCGSVASASRGFSTSALSLLSNFSFLCSSLQGCRKSSEVLRAQIEG